MKIDADREGRVPGESHHVSHLRKMAWTKEMKLKNSFYLLKMPIHVC